MMVPATSQNEKMSLVAYLASKLGTTPEGLVGTMPFEVVAVTINGKPMGAVLYINYRQTQYSTRACSIEMACAGEKGWLTRQNLRQLFEYPFVNLRVWNVLSLVDRGNKGARKFNRKLGFRELCVIPSGTMPTDDTILYGMTRDECRWLSSETPKPDFTLNVTAGAYANG